MQRCMKRSTQTSSEGLMPILAKPCQPPAGVVNIGIDFCVTESDEPPPLWSGKEGFTWH